jgi:hypothetical protein
VTIASASSAPDIRPRRPNRRNLIRRPPLTM